MKKFFLLLVLSLLILSVSADAQQYVPGDVVRIKIQKTDDGYLEKKEGSIFIVVKNKDESMTGIADRLTLSIEKPDGTMLVEDTHPEEYLSGIYRYNFTPRTNGLYKAVVVYDFYEYQFKEISLFNVKENEKDLFSRVCEKLGNNIYLEQRDETKYGEHIAGMLKEQKEEIAELSAEIQETDTRDTLVDKAKKLLFEETISIVSILLFACFCYFAYAHKKKQVYKSRQKVVSDIKT